MPRPLSSLPPEAVAIAFKRQNSSDSADVQPSTLPRYFQPACCVICSHIWTSYGNLGQSQRPLLESKSISGLLDSQRADLELPGVVVDESEDHYDPEAGVEHSMPVVATHNRYKSLQQRPAHFSLPPMLDEPEDDANISEFSLGSDGQSVIFGGGSHRRESNTDFEDDAFGFDTSCGSDVLPSIAEAMPPKRQRPSTVFEVEPEAVHHFHRPDRAETASHVAPPPHSSAPPSSALPTLRPESVAKADSTSVSDTDSEKSQESEAESENDKKDVNSDERANNKDREAPYLKIVSTTGSPTKSVSTNKVDDVIADVIKPCSTTDASEKQRQALKELQVLPTDPEKPPPAHLYLDFGAGDLDIAPPVWDKNAARPDSSSEEEDNFDDHTYEIPVSAAPEEPSRLPLVYETPVAEVIAKPSFTRQSSIPKDVTQIQVVPMTRKAAQNVLFQSGLREGGFLFRESRGVVVLSLVSEHKVLHFNVQEGFKAMGTEIFSTKHLLSFVAHYAENTDGYLPTLLR